MLLRETQRCKNARKYFSELFKTKNFTHKANHKLFYETLSNV